MNIRKEPKCSHPLIREQEQSFFITISIVDEYYLIEYKVEWAHTWCRCAYKTIILIQHHKRPNDNKHNIHKPGHLQGCIISQKVCKLLQFRIILTNNWHLRSETSPTSGTSHDCETNPKINQDSQMQIDVWEARSNSSVRNHARCDRLQQGQPKTKIYPNQKPSVEILPPINGSKANPWYSILPQEFVDAK